MSVPLQGRTLRTLPRNRWGTGSWVLLLLLLPAGVLLRSAGAAGTASRLIVYDVRGADAAETTLFFDRQGQEVKLWMRDDLGVRTGEVPVAEFEPAFEALKSIRTFALKPEYRGLALRARAARGSVTLAWQGSDGVKQVQTIRYYAPEHTLDDFRTAFNTVWGLSRFAILSLSSLESPRQVLREDAVFFMSGSGWMTTAEVRSALDLLKDRGQGERAARAIWGALDQSYPPQSPLAAPEFRQFCVRQAFLQLGAPAAAFLERQLPACPPARRPWAEKLLEELRQREPSGSGP